MAYKKKAYNYAGKYKKAYSMFTRETKLFATVVLSVAFLYLIWYAADYYALTGLYAYLPSIFALLAGGLMVIHKNYKTTFFGIILMAVSSVAIAIQYGFVTF